MSRVAVWDFSELNFSGFFEESSVHVANHSRARFENWRAISEISEKCFSSKIFFFRIGARRPCGLLRTTSWARACPFRAATRPPPARKGRGRGFS